MRLKPTAWPVEADQNQLCDNEQFEEELRTPGWCHVVSLAALRAIDWLHVKADALDCTIQGLKDDISKELEEVPALSWAGVQHL